MDETKENPDSTAQDYAAKVAELEGPIRDLTEALKKKIFGQDEAIAAVVKTMQGKFPSRRPLILSGPAGVGKTQAIKEMAKMMLNPKGGKTPGVIFIDEPHTMSEGELADAIAVATGKPTRKELGDEAAQACRDGVAVTPMKPLALKRGFSYAM